MEGHFYEKEQIVGNIHENILIQFLRSIITPYVITPKPLISWVLDCTKRVLKLALEQRTGRGGVLFRKQDVETDLLTQTSGILAEIENWEHTLDYDLASLVEMGHHYAGSCEEVPMGIRAVVANEIALATRYLLQALCLEEYGNNNPPYYWVSGAPAEQPQTFLTPEEAYEAAASARV